MESQVSAMRLLPSASVSTLPLPHARQARSSRLLITWDAVLQSAFLAQFASYWPRAPAQ